MRPVLGSETAAAQEGAVGFRAASFRVVLASLRCNESKQLPAKLRTRQREELLDFCRPLRALALLFPVSECAVSMTSMLSRRSSALPASVMIEQRHAVAQTVAKGFLERTDRAATCHC